MTFFNQFILASLLFSTFSASYADSSELSIAARSAGLSIDGSSIAGSSIDSPPVSESSTSSSIVGETLALERVDKMLEKLGGRKVWANTKSLYTVERVRHYKYGDGIVETVWRDLEKPGASIKLMHPDLNLVYAWNSQQGWVSRDGVLRDLSEDEIHQKEVHWQRDLYTLFHQLALGERKFTVKLLKPDGFRIFDEEKKKISEIRLTRSGELYQWQRFGSQKSETYIYGPLKSFGIVNFPDWSTTTDGHWRSYIVQVQPSFKSFDSHVPMEKPESDCSDLAWQGGAVNTNCHENKH